MVLYLQRLVFRYYKIKLFRNESEDVKQSNSEAFSPQIISNIQYMYVGTTNILVIEVRVYSWSKMMMYIVCVCVCVRACMRACACVCMVLLVYLVNSFVCKYIFYLTHTTGHCSESNYFTVLDCNIASESDPKMIIL